MVRGRARGATFGIFLLLIALMTSACGPGSANRATPRVSFAATAFPLQSGAGDLPLNAPPSVDALPPTIDPNATEQPFPEVHGEPDLDRVVALNVAGVTLATSSLSGREAAEGGRYLPAMLEALERGESDLSTAVASDAAGNLPLVLFVVRVRGVSPTAMLGAFLSATKLEDSEEIDAGGKRVRRVVADWTSYVYASNDMLIIVQALDPAHAEEALRQLP